jgi:hypothetical protein
MCAWRLPCTNDPHTTHNCIPSSSASCPRAPSPLSRCLLALLAPPGAYQGEPEHDASSGYRASYIVASMSEEILLFELVHFIKDNFKGLGGHGPTGKSPHATAHVHGSEEAVDHYVDGSWLGMRGDCFMIQWRQEIAGVLVLVFYASEVITEVARLRTGSSCVRRARRSRLQVGLA